MTAPVPPTQPAGFGSVVLGHEAERRLNMAVETEYMETLRCGLAHTYAERQSLNMAVEAEYLERLPP